MTSTPVTHAEVTPGRSVGSLDALFTPARVAVVGAGRSPTNLGHMVVRNLLQGGFSGDVYPINLHRASIGGVPAYPSVLVTPAPADLAIVCVRAERVLDVVRECGERGVKGIIVIAAGFRETGAAGRELERRIAAEAARHEGTRILGPNCLGLMVPRLGLNASFAAHLPPAGSIALVSQSGALAAAAIEWAIGKGIGFSAVVSLGNMLDVDFADLIEYFERDEATRSMVVYAESVTGAQRFISAAQAFTRTKPIVVEKVGRFAESAKAAVSHTGAMAGADDVYDAAFRRAGIIRVPHTQALFTTAELLAATSAVRGGALAVVTNAGGPGVMAADALIARHGSFAELAPATIARLDEVLPPAWSHRNPVDVLGDAPAERYRAAVETVLADPGTDAVLVMLTPQAMTDVVGTADTVIEAQRSASKPVLAVWMGGGEQIDEAVRRLTAAGVACYPYPELAVDAFVTLADFARQRAAAGRPAASAVDTFVPDRGRACRAIAAASGSGLLSEIAAKELLAAYGLDVTLPRLATSAGEAVALADAIGYPVVLKIDSPEITHKTDVGGVAVNLASAEEVRAAFDRIVASVREKRPGARVDGVSVQQMVSAGGEELILGAHRDATFGPVVMVAAGGVATQVLKDQRLELAPVDEQLGRTMLTSLRIWPLLEGYRGRPGADLRALARAIARFSRLVVEHPEIAEIEMNPLLAGEHGAVALDARATVDRAVLDELPAESPGPGPDLPVAKAG